MIIREHDNDFVLVEQHHHAKLSGEIMERWKDNLFEGKGRKESVLYAIEQHDLGWKEFDKQPFWNDAKQEPFTFTDFPIHPKVILYTLGIDEVEKADPYAALLCSEHYKRFIAAESSRQADLFVRQETARQERIMENLPDFNKRLFNFHYGLVQLGDNFSLYVCINDPGVGKQDEHPFFKQGIPLPFELDGFHKNPIGINWLDEQTVSLETFPFEGPVEVTVNQKRVKKQDIREHGLIKCYEEAQTEGVPVRLVPAN
ncbi:DUF3891 family protein [Virgibacillus xinjiangensis]|uniref:DUF3891 family protein n=1 Tax=Virgibacillus xinjiangensis TaxID=393090 RepID=A0ABV7CYY8_9BACI